MVSPSKARNPDHSVNLLEDMANDRDRYKTALEAILAVNDDVDLTAGRAMARMIVIARTALAA